MRKRERSKKGEESRERRDKRTERKRENRRERRPTEIEFKPKTALPKALGILNFYSLLRLPSNLSIS